MNRRDFLTGVIDTIVSIPVLAAVGCLTTLKTSRSTSHGITYCYGPDEILWRGTTCTWTYPRRGLATTSPHCGYPIPGTNVCSYCGYEHLWSDSDEPT
jgi:hypothetical protein